MTWREKKFGRLSGGELETCIRVFSECWAIQDSWHLAQDPDRWLESIEKFSKIPNWASCYEHSLINLVARLVVISGTEEALLKAAKEGRVVDGFLEAVEDLPDDPPDHPEAMPLALAMIGNLQAIALYSRSMNDMLKDCRESGNLKLLFAALSVDSIISTLPFCQSALRMGQLAGDVSAADEILSAIKGPHRKRLIYPELRWAEYLLRDQGAFEVCTKEEIYELLVVNLSLYDAKASKLDPKAGLFKLLRTWQKEAGIQKLRFGFSVKPV